MVDRLHGPRSDTVPDALSDTLSTRTTAFAPGTQGARTPPVPVQPDLPTSPLGAMFEQRYVARTLLGAGGMGEVRLCSDSVIGREVAMKVIRPELAQQGGAATRFVQEARVQGQLEHPSIVPVYDLGVTPDGAAYFTMKRVRGSTLDAVLAALAAGDSVAMASFSRRRLLGAMVSVCLAVDFAHKHGVLHRDLKPGNIILGDFGEVSVLDWGLAKIVGDDALDTTLTGSVAPVSLSLRSSQQTQAGAMLGTPGYMAPEQARGEIERLDERADVYALGAILFEILALEPLHTSESVVALLESTLRGADARPSARGRSDVPQDLESICVRATAVDPNARLGTARALADALEAFLDGELAVDMRRKMAASHVAAARAALESASAGTPSAAARPTALRELGRALSLDPANADALRTIADLLADLPRELPPEAEAQLERSAHLARRDAAGESARRFRVWIALLLLPFWMGIRAWLPAAIVIAGIVATGAFAFWVSRRETVRRTHSLVLLAANAAVVASLSTLLGPFLIVPGIAATSTMLFAMHADTRERRIAIASGCLAVALPFLLEVSGLVPRSFVFTDGLIHVMPRVVSLPEIPTSVCLLLTSLSMIVVPAVAMGRIRDALIAAERKVFLQSWQVEQLVPEEARRAVAPPRAA